MTNLEATDLMAHAIKEAQDGGYTKPHDLVYAIRVALRQAGVKLVQDRRAKEKA
jgi:hypothetical protein